MAAIVTAEAGPEAAQHLLHILAAGLGEIRQIQIVRTQRIRLADLLTRRDARRQPADAQGVYLQVTGLLGDQLFAQPVQMVEQ